MASWVRAKPAWCRWALVVVYPKSAGGLFSLVTGNSLAILSAPTGLQCARARSRTALSSWVSWRQHGSGAGTGITGEVAEDGEGARAVDEACLVDVLDPAAVLPERPCLHLGFGLPGQDRQDRVGLAEVEVRVLRVRPCARAVGRVVLPQSPCEFFPPRFQVGAGRCTAMPWASRMYRLAIRAVVRDLVVEVSAALFPSSVARAGARASAVGGGSGASRSLGGFMGLLAG